MIDSKDDSMDAKHLVKLIYDALVHKESGFTFDILSNLVDQNTSLQRISKLEVREIFDNLSSNGTELTLEELKYGLLAVSDKSGIDRNDFPNILAAILRQS